VLNAETKWPIFVEAYNT